MIDRLMFSDSLAAKLGRIVILYPVPLGLLALLLGSPA